MRTYVHRWIDYWNAKVKRLGIFELKMTQLGTIAFALILAKLFPQIMTLSIWWFVAALLVCAVPVQYALWFRNAA